MFLFSQNRSSWLRHEVPQPTISRLFEEKTRYGASVYASYLFEEKPR